MANPAENKRTGDKPEDDPSGEHDPKALEDAERKFHAEGKPDAPDDVTEDPTGGHDKKALKEGAQRMGVQR